MEFTLRDVGVKPLGEWLCGLNPCFCGIYSQSDFICVYQKQVTSLNPCFCGIYSQSEKFTYVNYHDNMS